MFSFRFLFVSVFYLFFFELLFLFIVLTNASDWNEDLEFEDLFLRVGDLVTPNFVFLGEFVLTFGAKREAPILPYKSTSCFEISWLSIA